MLGKSKTRTEIANEYVYLPPILVPVVKLKKQYIYKFSKRLNYEKQEEKIHKIVQT